MLKPLLWGAGLALISFTANAQSVGTELANLREDVRLLTQKVGALTLKVEDLERDNEALRKQVAAAARRHHPSGLSSPALRLSGKGP